MAATSDTLTASLPGNYSFFSKCICQNRRSDTKRFELLMLRSTTIQQFYSSSCLSISSLVSHFCRVFLAYSASLIRNLVEVFFHPSSLVPARVVSKEKLWYSILSYLDHCCFNNVTASIRHALMLVSATLQDLLVSLPTHHGASPAVCFRKHIQISHSCIYCGDGERFRDTRSRVEPVHISHLCLGKLTNAVQPPIK